MKNAFSKDQIMGATGALACFFLLGFYNETKSAIADVNKMKADVNALPSFVSELREIRLELGTVKNFLNDIKTRRCGDAARKGE
jgi:hypothetical protein